MSVNKIILIGNVGNDPEIKQVGENKLAKFSLATSESYKNKQGEKIENAEWHSVIVWGKLAEIVEKYVKKGSKLYIEGKIEYKSYEKAGEKKYFTQIKCSNIKMLGNIEKTAQQPKEKPQTDIEEDDDLPF